MPKRVLLIGGNGFIGSHLIDKFCLSNWHVSVIDMYNERYRSPKKEVEYHIGSNLQNSELFELISVSRIVIYLASSTVPSTSNVDIKGDIQNNLLSFINILDLSIKANIDKFVYFSSGGAVYGTPITQFVDETHPRNPISSYGIIKATAENYLELYSRTYGLNYLIIRPSNPYGPRQSHTNSQGVISTFLRKSISNEPFTVFGDGSSKKDYIYIEDLVETVFLLVQQNYGGTFNIGSGKGISLNEIIESINSVTTKQNEVNYVAMRSYDVNNFILSIKKVEQSLKGQNSLTTLEDGIRKTHDWLLKF